MKTNRKTSKWNDKNDQNLNSSQMHLPSTDLVNVCNSDLAVEEGGSVFVSCISWSLSAHLSYLTFQCSCRCGPDWETFVKQRKWRAKLVGISVSTWWFVALGILSHSQTMVSKSEKLISLLRREPGVRLWVGNEAVQFVSSFLLSLMVLQRLCWSIFSSHTMWPAPSGDFLIYLNVAIFTKADRTV